VTSARSVGVRARSTRRARSRQAGSRSPCVECGRKPAQRRSKELGESTRDGHPRRYDPVSVQPRSVYRQASEKPNSRMADRSCCDDAELVRLLAIQDPVLEELCKRPACLTELIAGDGLELEKDAGPSWCGGGRSIALPTSLGSVQPARSPSIDASRTTASWCPWVAFSCRAATSSGVMRERRGLAALGRQGSEPRRCSRKTYRDRPRSSKPVTFRSTVRPTANACPRL
jgi:hypothetical protein